MGEEEEEEGKEEEGALDGVGACDCMVVPILHKSLLHTASNHPPASSVLERTSEQY